MEKLVLENDNIKVEILPEYGGKIVSIFYKESQFEFVAKNRRLVYEKSDISTSFSDRDASGIDDVFPSFEEEVVELEGRRIAYTDHGEIWRNEFQVLKASSCEVELLYSSNEMDYDYSKKITLLENGINLSFCIQNRRAEVLPCIWGFHGLFRYESDMEFIYPKNTKRFINVFEGKELGAVGSCHSAEGHKYNFQNVNSILPNSAVKYYVDGRVEEGRCGYCYPSYHMMCEMRYDKNILPYLGVWITAGGYRSDYNCALEPTNGFYDTVQRSMTNNKIYYLSKDKPLKFELQITCRKYE